MRPLRFPYYTMAPTVYHMLLVKISVEQWMCRPELRSENPAICGFCYHMRLKEFLTHQDKDTILQELKQFWVQGWPDKLSVDRTFQPYLAFWGELTAQDRLSTPQQQNSYSNITHRQTYCQRCTTATWKKQNEGRQKK